MLRINVGSKNPVKIKAVEEVLEEYNFLKPFEINSFEVPSEVKEQPIGIEEIVLGAKNRAKNSFLNCDYGIGLESGLISPDSDSFLDICSCSIYDGNDFYSGLSEAFEIPRYIVKLILEEKLDLSRATKKAGLTNSKKIGNEKGVISILSGGRFERRDQMKTALRMALIPLENSRYYK